MDLKIKDIAHLLVKSEKDVLILVKAKDIPHQVIHDRIVFNKDKVIEWALGRNMPLNISGNAHFEEYRIKTLLPLLNKTSFFYNCAFTDDHYIEEMVQLASFDKSVDRSVIVQLLKSREQMMSTAIGHGISLIVDDRADNAFNLTDRFQYHVDSYDEGSLVYPLSAIDSGPRRLKLKAWDSVNNVATLEFDVEIGSDNNLTLRDLLNYPNPMSSETSFYFVLTQDVEELQVRVYTLSGKNIWSTSRYDLRADRYPTSEVAIVWNGCDDKGDRVANGVYLYRVAVSTGSETAEEFGKIVVLN